MVFILEQTYHINGIEQTKREVTIKSLNKFEEIFIQSNAR